MRGKQGQGEKMDITLKILLAIVIIGFCWIGYRIIFDQQIAENFCQDKVFWANPQWFYCGKSNFPENYHTMGMFPPVTIQTFYEWEKDRK